MYKHTFHNVCVNIVFFYVLVKTMYFDSDLHLS